jgi:hypothetical protein
MKVECGDVVEVLWPEGTGFHQVLGHSGNDTVIVSIKNDREYRNATIPETQIQRIVESGR